MASMSVSSSPSGEQFNVDPYEKNHVLSDFDSSLKYVTINLKLEATDINNNSEKSGQQNALSLLMAARTAIKKAKTFDASRPKFTGRYSSGQCQIHIFAIFSQVQHKPDKIIARLYI